MKYLTKEKVEDLQNRKDGVFYVDEFYCPYCKVTIWQIAIQQKKLKCVRGNHFMEEPLQWIRNNG